MTAAHIQRSTTMLARPIKIDPAFSKAEVVSNLIQQGAPYKSITAVHKDPPNDNTPGWFRNFWALGGKVIFDGAEEAFHNPNFIAAAKQSFNAEVIQPLTMMTNLNTPSAASPAHLDLPFFFRGAHAREVPSHTVSPLFTNACVLADNEYMYHRVGQMGGEEDYLPNGISSKALLHRVKDGWEIRLDENLIKAYRHDQIRSSILWKAFCFKDQCAADLFADTSHDLTPGQVVNIFCADLTDRGITFAEPTDLESDQRWINTIDQHYPPNLSA